MVRAFGSGTPQRLAAGCPAGDFPGSAMIRHSGELVVSAHAKINLSLDVLAKRNDGYHELRSVMQTISLRDSIRLIRGGEPPARSAELDLSLIDRAIESVRQAAGISETAGYSIDKVIPSAAGLGGGSSDCAATIRGVNRLFGGPLGHDALHGIATQLGSDVPFFLTGGTALIEGRGDAVTQLPDAPPTWLVLAQDRAPVSTAEVFMEMGESEFGNGSATEAVLAGLRGGRVVFGGNDLTAAAMRARPELEPTHEKLLSIAPAERIALSGSGGTFIVIFDSAADAAAGRDQIAGLVDWAEVTVTVGRLQALDDAPAQS